MKKYQQLILLVIAVIGTVFFLFYKHEYNRLRAVLQVLDTFGSQENNNAKLCALNSAGKSCISEQSCVSDVASAWRQIGNIYIFAASVLQSSSVQILTLGASLNFKTECLIWSEEENQPTSGRISINYIDAGTKSKNKIAVIKCAAERIVPKIYGVTLSVEFKQKIYQEFISIENEDENERKKDEIAICTLLKQKPFSDKLKLAEFIEFHRLIGVSHFYLYSDAIGPSTRKFLEEYQRKTTVRINVVHWTPPTALEESIQIDNTIYFNDCLVRSRVVADYVSILNISSILMPRFHEKLQNIIHDVEQIDSKARSYLQFYAKTFCLEIANDPDAGLPLISLQKTWWQNLETDVKYSLINIKRIDYISWDYFIKHNSLFRNYLVPSDVAVVHKYENCKGRKGEMKNENTAHKFVKMLKKDGVINLAIK